MACENRELRQGETEHSWTLRNTSSCSLMNSDLCDQTEVWWSLRKKSTEPLLSRRVKQKQHNPCDGLKQTRQIHTAFTLKVYDIHWFIHLPYLLLLIRVIGASSSCIGWEAGHTMDRSSVHHRDCGVFGLWEENMQTQKGSSCLSEGLNAELCCEATLTTAPLCCPIHHRFIFYYLCCNTCGGMIRWNDTIVKCILCNHNNMQNMHWPGPLLHLYSPCLQNAINYSL